MLSFTPPKASRQEILMDAIRGRYGIENQHLAGALNLYIAEAVALLNVNPVETVDVVLATDEAVIAFVAYVGQPSRKGRKEYMRRLDHLVRASMDYADKHS